MRILALLVSAAARVVAGLVVWIRLLRIAALRAAGVLASLPRLRLAGLLALTTWVLVLAGILALSALWVICHIVYSVA